MFHVSSHRFCFSANLDAQSLPNEWHYYSIKDFTKGLQKMKVPTVYVYYADIGING